MTTSKHYPRILTSLAILSTMMPMKAKGQAEVFGFGSLSEPEILNWHMCQAFPNNDFEQVNPGKWEPLCENIRTNLPTEISIPMYAYHLTPEQMNTFVAAVKENHTIRYLDMRYTALGSDDTSRLLDALKNNDLKGLDLSENFMLGKNMKEIGSFLAEHQGMETLIIGHHYWRPSKDADPEPKLFSREDVKPLADAVRGHKGLRHLSIQGQCLTSEALEELFDALKENKSVTSLVLEEAFEDKAKCTDLVTAYLMANPYVKSVNIWNGELGAGSGVKIANALKHNTNLTQLWASGNGFDKGDYKAIAEMLPQNHTLETLYCEDYADVIDKETGTLLANAMLENSSITTPAFINYQKMDQRDIINIKQAARFNQDHKGQNVTLKQWRKTHTPNPRVIQDWERNPL